MDPDAALRRIDVAPRLNAETRAIMRDLHNWLVGGGFAPAWGPSPKGTRRFRRAYGQQHATAPSKARAANVHASMQIGDGHSFGIGAIVRRADINAPNRYVIVDIKDPWIYTRRISGSGGPGIVTPPTPLMLAKVNP